MKDLYLLKLEGFIYIRNKNVRKVSENKYYLINYQYQDTLTLIIEARSIGDCLLKVKFDEIFKLRYFQTTSERRQFK